jgi:hypothetical protein
MKVGGDQNWFICPCGNEPHKDGFYSCNADGAITVPLVGGDWEGDLYVCGLCSNIISSNTLEIVGKCSDQIKLDNDRFDWSKY